MTPLIRKEIRLMLPSWGLAMFLAIVPMWLLPEDTYVRGIGEIVFWLFSFGVLLLGLAPFGQEFGLGTFSSMLAQPVERRRIWKTKILLLVAAAALVFVAFILSLYERLGVTVYIASNQIQVPGEIWQAAKASLILIALALSGGFWTTLLFRQTGAAMWFAILVPGVLIIAVQTLVHGFSPQAEDLISVLVLLCYCAAGFVWARRMFARAQDFQWLGENVAFLSFSPSKTRTETAAPRHKSALRALICKEFQSHQIGLIIAFGLLVLHVCSLLYRRFGDMSSNSEARFAVESVPFLWLLVPWLLGSVAIAEERKLGTMESQLCLPVNRRLQFAVKLIVVLLLGIMLGGIMPSLLETLGARFHISSQIVPMSQVTNNLVVPNAFNVDFYRGIILLCIVAGYIAVASFFASSLTRNTLQALGAAIILGSVLFMLFQWTLIELSHDEYSLWKGPLILFIGVPVALITVFWLSFSNYKILHAGRNMWLRNLLILAVTLFLTGIASAFIYQRPWELAMSLEPHHGTPRLAGPIQPAVCTTIGRTFALLPDGRLWAAADYHLKEFDTYEERWDPVGQSNRLQKLQLQLPNSGTFVGGSNWIALAGNGGAFGVVALQSDGTLWKILTADGRTKTNRAAWFSLTPQPHRIGSDNDWKSVAAGANYVFAVKTNGTLWGWGDNESGQFAPDTRPYVPEPVRIGKDSDWAEVFPRGLTPIILKKDNTLFEFDWSGQLRRAALTKVFFSGKDMMAAAGTRERSVMIHHDGTMWAAGYPPRVLFGDHNIHFDMRRDILARVGDRSDWTQVSGDYSYFAALRKNGALVRNNSELFSSALAQPSKYSDWIALNFDWNGLVALASDGTITVWRDIRTRNDFLLAATHRPLWSLNIFTDSKN